MELSASLEIFYALINDDARMGPTHISLYMALIRQWTIKGGMNPFDIKRKELMQIAKISARHTYNKCLNNLQEYGYIIYYPASSRFTLSECFLKHVV